MNIKLSEIEGIIKGIEAFSVQRIPIKMSIQIGRFIKKLEIERKIYEETRIKLCKFYCLKDENGNPVIENNQYKGLSENTEWIKECTDLNQEIVNIEFDGISVNALEKEGIKLSIIETCLLDSILID